MIITISREFWSWGHSIWQKVAKKLNIPFYDNEIVQEISQESWYSLEFIKNNDEYIDQKSTFFSLWVPYPGWFDDPKDKIFAIQCKAILDLAKKWDCVFVWRCADYVLKTNWIKSFNVFIYSDKENRAKRILEKYWETDTPIEKRINTKDRQRETYFKYYTDEERWDYHNYELCLNSGFLWEDKCVDYIINAIK